MCSVYRVYVCVLCVCVCVCMCVHACVQCFMCVHTVYMCVHAVCVCVVNSEISEDRRGR